MQLIDKNSAWQNCHDLVKQRNERYQCEIDATKARDTPRITVHKTTHMKVIENYYHAHVASKVGNGNKCGENVAEEANGSGHA